MKLIVWNSQGSKWDIFWNAYLTPQLGTDDIGGFLVEAGVAPFAIPPPYTINTVYKFPTNDDAHDQQVATTSPFCAGVKAQRGRQAYWIPWVKTIDTQHPQPRCSMGAVGLTSKKVYFGEVRREDADSTDRLFSRPIFSYKAGVNTGSGAFDPKLTILLVHLTAYAAKAQDQLDSLIARMTNIIPQGTPGLIVGDLNIDLLKYQLQLPAKWRFLNTGQATQQSGGELDYGILYDPNNTFASATVIILANFKTLPNNPSDHAVLGYQIDIK